MTAPQHHKGGRSMEDDCVYTHQHALGNRELNNPQKRKWRSPELTEVEYVVEMTEAGYNFEIPSSDGFTAYS